MIGQIIGAMLGYSGQQQTNSQNADIALQNNQFNSAEAAINRGFNEQQAQTNRVYQSEQNQKAMDFSREMANTGYQRTVKDMEAAGLNPMLAYTQGPGASPTGVTSAGSAATGSPASSSGNPVMGNKWASALASAQQLANLDLTQEQTAKTRSEKWNVDSDTELKQQKHIESKSTTELNIASAGQAGAATKNLTLQFGKINEEIKLLTEQVSNERARNLLIRAQTNLANMQNNQSNTQASLNQQLTQLHKVETELKDLGKAYWENESNIAKSQYGEVMQAIRKALDLIPFFNTYKGHK